MSGKTMIYAILRWISALAALMLIVTLCGGSSRSDADPAEVTAAVTAELDMSTMQAADNQMVKRLYGLAPSDYEGLFLYYPTTNMGAEEVLVVKLKDPAQADAVRAAVEKRLDTQKTSFDGYGVEQYDLLTNHCVVEVQGNYVLFVVNPEADKALAAFRSAL